MHIMFSIFKSLREDHRLSTDEIGTFGENSCWRIPIHHKVFKIFKKNESQLCEVLRNKFGCISTLVSPAVEVNNSSPQVFRKRLTSQLELSVWKDDLTTHAVDAVVNAANEDLQHGGGLAMALVKAGGPEIQDQSFRFVAAYGKVPVGEIAITGSGNLPCQLIIHAVGPRWTNKDAQGCIKRLKMAIMNILDYVSIRNPKFETVAIPALSSGIFQFPLELCVRTIVNTINFYFQNNQPDCNLKEIHLVSNEDPTVAAFKCAAENILGENELWCSGTEGMPPPSDTRLQIYQYLTLEIVQKGIEEEMTDIIVNSVSLSNLTCGTVSKAILQKAGDEMQLEFNEEIKWRKKSQAVVVTKGFKLFCQYVFHVLWNQNKFGDQVKQAMKTCLEKCLELSVTSISFPVLENRKFSMDKAAVAKIMFDEVVKFAKDKLKRQLTVKFVIFPGELDTYKAFTTEMRETGKLLGLGYQVPKRTGPEAKYPTMDLMGRNNEQMCEAQAWIQKMKTLWDHHIIENNHIFYFGKKEYDILSQLQENTGVSICEILNPGRACLELKGAQADLIQGIMNIEHMLCEVQEEVARKKEQALWSLSGQWTGQQPTIQEENKEEIKFKRYKVTSPEDQKKEFQKCGLQVIKVEKIDNSLLLAAFQNKKKMMEERKHKHPVSHRLFQQVPRQFCDLICRVGFHRMYSVPSDPTYGAGIYFTRKLRTLADKAKNTPAKDKLIYIFEAEVLTGSFCQGKQCHVVPPPLSPGDIDSHDSVVDSVANPDTFVIFSGTQAMPLFLWTCTQPYVPHQNSSSGPLMLLSQQPWGRPASGSSVD
ncbi:protein mono-ADP-ribosyltransferase PARP9 isoform X2 [Ochotona curzoniae]|uniref:protein mono-ADP-ribosyltransferase PARP9 isoform X2 n=1 Tax=Ochotona curzoniae TaxID=130825 RepID=UPI001B3536C0|nr:protein mono-ADP-ribosyltransferase PARP9 isoform X2 [Ochotona curzoniae]